VLQQNFLPNFLEAAPSGGSFQKIGCAIVFAQALSSQSDTVRWEDKTMQVTLNGEQVEFIRTQIQRGIFANPEQAIAAALRLLEVQSSADECLADECLADECLADECLVDQQWVAGKI
jgi:hypothetical protein